MRAIQLPFQPHHWLPDVFPYTTVLGTTNDAEESPYMITEDNYKGAPGYYALNSWYLADSPYNRRKTLSEAYVQSRTVNKKFAREHWEIVDGQVQYTEKMQNLVAQLVDRAIDPDFYPGLGSLDQRTYWIFRESYPEINGYLTVRFWMTAKALIEEFDMQNIGPEYSPEAWAIDDTDGDSGNGAGPSTSTFTMQDVVFMTQVIRNVKMYRNMYPAQFPTVDQILEEYPDIPVSKIKNGINYYIRNEPEVRELWDRLGLPLPQDPTLTQ